MEAYPDGSRWRNADKPLVRRVTWVVARGLTIGDWGMVREAMDALSNDAEHGLVQRNFTVAEYHEIRKIILHFSEDLWRQERERRERSQNLEASDDIERHN